MSTSSSSNFAFLQARDEQLARLGRLAEKYLATDAAASAAASLLMSRQSGELLTQTRVGQFAPSLPGKAFRGELVKLDPNDEPKVTVPAERKAKELDKR